MGKKVLVAYATKYGATAEIAERISQVLCQKGLDIDVLSFGLISNLTQYDAVIIGSASYIGQWRKEAVKFLKSNEKWLSERPVWLFSSGPTGEGEPVQLTKGWRFPKSQQSTIDRIQPRDVAVFHGMIDTEKLNFFEKMILRIVKPSVGDFRDWNAITAWAEAIASELKE